MKVDLEDFFALAERAVQQFEANGSLQPGALEDNFDLIAKSIETLAEAIKPDGCVGLTHALTTPEVVAALRGLSELPEAVNNLAEAVREQNR